MTQVANFQFRKRLHLSALVALLAISAAVAVISGLVTAQSVGDWYVGLNKPPFNPPNSVFGPVWTALYIAMAVAAWRVWRTGPAAAVVQFSSMPPRWPSISPGRCCSLAPAKSASP